MAILMALATIACERPPEEATPDEEDELEPHGPFYSPWVITVRGENLPFDEISFKDVGMSSLAPSHRAEIYEAIARSLADELEAHEALSASVRHSEAAARPEHHLHCAPRHVYVDLWQGRQPERWGYSLWSGCTDELRFAWREVPRPAGLDERAMSEEVARSIEAAIHEALRTRCFRRSC